MTAAMGLCASMVVASHGTELKLPGSNLLFADDALTLWQADGNTRVAPVGFEPAEQLWDGHALRPRPTADIVDGLTAQQSRMQGIRLAAARREYESFQLILTPRQKDLTVQGVSITDFVMADGVATISSEHIQQNLVGYISGEIQPRGDQWLKTASPGEVMGPFPDILMPVGSWQTAMVGMNYNLWFTIQIPVDAAAGIYSATLSLQIVEADLLEVPIELTVWDFELPLETAIDSHLMSLDLSSLCYTYRVAPWEDRALELVDQWAQLMVRHRFSPALVPEAPRPDIRRFPAQVDGPRGQALAFDGSEITLAGPDDHQMRDRFTLCFWLKTLAGSEGRIVEEQWLSALQSPAGLRPVGHSVRLEDGNLVAEIGHGTWNPTDPMEARQFEQLGVDWKSGPTHSAVHTPWPDDEQWHHVAFVYAPGQLQFLVDGQPVAQTTLNDVMSPSYGIVALGGPQSRFDISELRWTDVALSPSQVIAEMNSPEPVVPALSAYDFSETLYQFETQRARYAAEGADEEFALSRAAWWADRGLYINTFSTAFATGLDDLPALGQRCELLRTKGLLDRCVLVVPHDETPFGPRAEENRRFAQEVHRQIPGLRVYMTLGGMKGLASTKQEKADAIAAYGGAIDVWSMIPSIFTTFHETHFGDYIAAGAEFSPYIHRTDVVQDDLTTAASRRFFWYLWKYDIDMFTLWCTTLWSQPSKMGETRAAKRTWPVERGLQTIKRNHGISDGTLFYPGPDGLLGSIRASCWRDGMEDFEYLSILANLVEAADPAAPAVQEARKLLAEMKDIQVYGTNWEKPPTKDSGFFYTQRRRIAAAILQIKRSG